MDKIDIYDKLLKFMYDEYNAGRNAAGRGERVHVLVDHFERASPGNRIGDAFEKRGAVSYLYKHGWIDVVDALGRQLANANSAYMYGRMIPTPKGREYLNQIKFAGINRVVGTISESAGRFIKGTQGS